jgi:Reverse transcriptase (RNA-dependent DNA polymerase)
VATSQLKSSDSKDIYGFSNNLTKTYTKQLSRPLCDLYNFALKIGIFPDQLKISCVKPIHKASDKTKISNYRPISLIPIFSKILEKVILSRLNEHLTAKQVLNSSQFGFVSKSNTEVAVAHLMNTVYSNLS